MARATAPGLKDVAAHAGVSVATVSRVINGGPYVTESARAKVEASMAAIGYEPHALAQSLRTGQTRSVGYLISDIANPLFATIARGIDDTLQAAGYTTFLANSRGDPAHELTMIRQLLRRRVDGLILSLADETSGELRAALKKLTVPLVLLDREVPGARADRVLVDHAAGVRAAVAHLAGRGHRRIALITGPPTTRPGRAIHAAFAAAMAELGLPLDPAHCAIGPSDEAFGATALRSLLAGPARPTAILAGGAQITVGALRAIRALELRVPQDLALVAYDDTDVTALFAPAVTVVARDIHRIGAESARLLLERLRADAPATRGRTVVIPTGLVARGSV